MNEKSKNKPSQLKKWLIGLGIFLLIAVAGFALFIIVLANSIAGVGEWLGGEPVNLRDEEARQFIAAYPINTPLPEDAEEIYLHYYAFQDFNANIRFSASPESVETWLNGNDFCFTELIENEPAYLFRDEPHLEWWQANEASRYALAHQCGDNPYYELVIDQSNPEFWIVYLAIFST